MLIIILLLSILNSSQSSPVQPSSQSIPNDHITLFGRELPVDVTHYRTTQDIILSCLATIFACTWVAVHPNLPGPWDSEWMKVKRRVAMMVYAMLAPELMTMWAMLQWVAARKIVEKFNEKSLREEKNAVDSDQDGKYECLAGLPWRLSIWKVLPTRSTVQGCWATIKNEVLKWFKGPDRRQPKDYRWTITHGFFIQMGGFILCDDSTTERVVIFDDLEGLLDRGEVDRPKVTESEINDKSKGDFLTKLLVVLQTTWFIFQCIARWILRLPVTEIEVVTLAFAILNIITYALWWKKPQNVFVAIPVQRKSGERSGWVSAHNDGRGDNSAYGSIRWGLKESAKRRMMAKAEVLKRVIARMMEGISSLLVWLIALEMATWETGREVMGERTLKEIARELELRGMDKEEVMKSATTMVYAVAGDLGWDMKGELEREFGPAHDRWEWRSWRDRWSVRALDYTESGRDASEWKWSRDFESITRAVGGVLPEGKAEEIERAIANQLAQQPIQARQCEIEVENKTSWITSKLKKTSWYRAPLMLIWAFLRPLEKVSGLTGNDFHPQSLRVPTFWKEHTDNRVDFPVLVIGVLFGAIHLIPWSFQFPSTLERWLWRSGTLVITVEPFTVLLLRLANTVNNRYHNKFSSSLFIVIGIPSLVGLPLYLLARFILLALAFTTLRALPQDAYQNVAWTTFIPHI